MSRVEVRHRRLGAELLNRRLKGRPAILGILREHPLDRFLYLERNVRAPILDGRERLMHVLVHGAHRRLSFKRQLPSQHFVCKHAQ